MLLQLIHSPLRDFINYGALGAVLLATLYHTILYFIRRTPLLGHYAVYLWSSFLFLGYTIIFETATQTDPVKDIINHFLFLASVQIYIRFIAEEVFNITRTGAGIVRIAYKSTYLISLAYLLTITCTRIFLPRNTAFERISINTFSILLILTCLALLISLFNQAGSLLFQRLVKLGAYSLLLFNALAFASHMNKPFLPETNYLFFICLGYFIENVLFSAAISVQLRTELLEKIAADKKILEQQGLLMESEIEKQSQIVHTRKAERMRITRDMHDEISNALAGLKFYIGDLRGNAKSDAEKHTLIKIEAEVKTVYQQARLFMHELNRSALQQHFDLGAFLFSLSEKFSKSSLSIRIAADRELLEASLDTGQQNYLYLIIKESLSNIMKYANASVVDINIHPDEAMWYLLIKDNGGGIRDSNNPGLGLSNIRTRIAEMGGSVRFESSASGTSISATFPRKDVPLH